MPQRVDRIEQGSAPGRDQRKAEDDADDLTHQSQHQRLDQELGQGLTLRRFNDEADEA